MSVNSTQLTLNSPLTQQEFIEEKGHIGPHNSPETTVAIDGCPRNTNIRGRAYIWTWNNYTEEDVDIMEEFCKEFCEKYVFQSEIGESGTRHMQGFWQFKNQRDFRAIKNAWPKIHFELAKNTEAAINYCSKEDTYSGEFRKTNITKKTHIEKIKDRKNKRSKKNDSENKRRPLDLYLKEDMLYDWQKEIIDRMKIIEQRKIYWYYDKIGGVGKSVFTRWLCGSFPNMVIAISGKAADIKYGITQFLDNPNNDLYLAIFDFERSMEDFVSYSAIEQIKNGYFYNTKFESKMVCFNIPQIVVFANFEPDIKKLSKDRWIIKNITKKEIDTGIKCSFD